MRFTFCWSGLVISALIALTGCSTLSTHESHHARGSLNEVMHRASDAYSGERCVGGGAENYAWADQEPFGNLPETESEIAVEGHVDPDPAQSLAAVTAGSGTLPNENVWFGVRGGAGMVTDQFFNRSLGLDLLLEISDSTLNPLRLVAGFQTLTLRENGNIVRAAVEADPLILSLGAEYVFFETAKNSFPGVYFSVGAQFDWMTWTYQNAVQVENGETIAADGLGGIDIYPCLGARIFQLASVALNVELRPGIKIWYGETTEGFTNDLFSPTPYVRLDVVLAFALQ